MCHFCVAEDCAGMPLHDHVLLLPRQTSSSVSVSFSSSCCRSALPLLFWHLAAVICLFLLVVGSAGPPFLQRVTTKCLTKS